MNRLLNSLVWILAGALILVCVWLSQVVIPWWRLTFLASAYWVVSGITGHDPVKNDLRKQLAEAADGADDED